jgi:hypothetical protein
LADLKVGTTYVSANLADLKVGTTYVSAELADLKVGTTYVATTYVATLVVPTFRSAYTFRSASTFRSAWTFERRQQRPPSIRHQHAVEDDESAGDKNEAPIGAACGLPDRSRIALPE